MASILITGASGFVGGHLVTALSTRHDRIYGLARRPRPHDVPAAVRWIQHDFCAATLPETMPNKIDIVIHLAQSQQYRRFPEGVVDVFDVNLRTTMLLLDWARTAGASRFVLLSTGGILGTSEQPLREDQPYVGEGALSFYFATKYSSEVLVHSFHGILSDVVLRPFFIYGPGQKPEMLIPRLAKRIAHGEPIALKGRDGLNINPIHVDDCVRAISATFNLAGSHVINIAGPEILSLRKISETIGSHLRIAPIFTCDENAKTGHIVADISKMRECLLAPSVGFSKGVRDMLERTPSA